MKHIHLETLRRYWENILLSMDALAGSGDIINLGSEKDMYDLQYKVVDLIREGHQVSVYTTDYKDVILWGIDKIFCGNVDGSIVFTTYLSMGNHGILMRGRYAAEFIEWLRMVARLQENLYLFGKGKKDTNKQKSQLELLKKNKYVFNVCEGRNKENILNAGPIPVLCKTIFANTEKEAIRKFGEPTKGNIVMVVGKEPADKFIKKYEKELDIESKLLKAIFKKGGK